MKMKYLLFLPLAFLMFALNSCSSDDSSDGDDNPSTANITFNVELSDSRGGIVTTKIQNSTETNENASFPFSETFVNQSVSANSFLELEYQKGNVVSCDTCPAYQEYTATLTILIDADTVVTQTFTIAEDTQVVRVNHTF